MLYKWHIILTDMLYSLICTGGVDSAGGVYNCAVSFVSMLQGFSHLVYWRRSYYVLFAVDLLQQMTSEVFLSSVFCVLFRARLL